MAQVVEGLELAVPERDVGAPAVRPAGAHDQGLVGAQEVGRHAVRGVGRRQRVSARARRGREHVRNARHERRGVALAGLRNHVEGAAPHERGGAAERRCDRGVRRRRRGRRHIAIDELDGQAQVGNGRDVGASDVLPVVTHGDAGGVRRERQPPAVPGRTAHCDLEGTVVRHVESGVVQRSRGPRWERTLNRTGLDGQRHVDRPGRPAPHAVRAGRVDRRVVVAGVGVVAEGLPPRRDDGTEHGVCGVVLELGLEADGQQVGHHAEALGDVDGIGQTPISTGETPADGAERGQ